MATAGMIATADQLLRASEIGRCELVAGELRMMSPAGFRHGVVTARIAAAMASHTEPRCLGTVLAAETGFLIARDPDTVRAPDVAFVRTARLAAGMPTGFFVGPPDLAVEVLSPSDLPGDTSARIDDWLRAGTQQVWVVDPEARTLVVYRQGEAPTAFSGHESVLGEAVIPGFVLPLDRVFV